MRRNPARSKEKAKEKAKTMATMVAVALIVAMAMAATFVANQIIQGLPVCLSHRPSMTTLGFNVITKSVMASAWYATFAKVLLAGSVIGSLWRLQVFVPNHHLPVGKTMVIHLSAAMVTLQLNLISPSILQL